MNNIEEILVTTLREIGCLIPEEITSLQQFTSEVFMEACCYMLKMTDSLSVLPSRIPNRGVENFKYSKLIAQDLKKMGYRPKCESHSFLYPNVADTREIISFLVDRLPRTEQCTGGKEHGKPNTIIGQLQSEIQASSTHPWLLPIFQKPCLFDHFSDHFVSPTMNNVVVDTDEYYSELNKKAKSGKDVASPNLRLSAIALLERSIQMCSLAHASAAEELTGWQVTFREKREKIRRRLPGRVELAARLRHGDESSVEGETAPSHASASTGSSAKLTGPTVNTPETVQGRMQAIQDDINKVQREISSLERATEGEEARAEKIRAGVAAVQTGCAKLEEEVKVASLLAAMLPDVDASVKKLDALNERVLGRITQVNAEWETQRAAFIARYNRLLEERREKQYESVLLSKKLKELRREIAALTDKLRQRQKVLQQLKEEYEGMNRSVGRSAYMQKISEMHQNLAQQRADIEDLVVNMRTLMAEASLTEERLGRAFREAEGMLSTAFQQNRQDDAYSAVYRRFNSFDQNYTELKGIYEGIGTVLNQVLDMDGRIGDQGRFETDKRMGKVKKDLDDLKKENSDLRSKIDVL